MTYSITFLRSYSIWDQTHESTYNYKKTMQYKVLHYLTNRLANTLWILWSTKLCRIAYLKMKWAKNESNQNSSKMLPYANEST